MMGVGMLRGWGIMSWWGVGNVMIGIVLFG